MKKGKITFLSNLPEWLRRTIAGVLIAALVGGGVYGILLLVRGSGGKVKVYPIMEFCTNYADDQAETQGLVKPDKMQSIYVSETQKITKYYVHEGDTVKVGDPILSYDTTLTDLQLERARISVQKLEIALDEANANLVKVNNYRLYVPQPDPLPDEEPDTPPLTPVDVPYFRGGDGTKDSPFFYIWSNNCAYDSAFIDSLLTSAGGSTAYVVFEVHDGDSPDGDILRSWGMVFVRQSDGSVAFKVDEAYGRFDDGTAPDDGGDIDDGGNTYIDTTPSYTYNELIAMRREAQEKIYQTELDLKKARLEYETLEFEINNGVVYSKIDGVVKTIRSPDQAREEQLPAVLISGGGGYYVTGAMSETELHGDVVADVFPDGGGDRQHFRIPGRGEQRLLSLEPGQQQRFALSLHRVFGRGHPRARGRVCEHHLQPLRQQCFRCISPEHVHPPRGRRELRICP